jgi:hypothetical protein
MMMKSIRARKVSTAVLVTVIVASYLIPYSSIIIPVAGQSSGNFFDKLNSRFKDVLPRNFQNIENVTDDSRAAPIETNEFAFEHQFNFNGLDEIDAQRIDSSATNDAVNNAEFSDETGDDGCTVFASRLDDDLGSDNNYVSQVNDQDTNEVVDGSAARDTGSNNTKFEEAGDARPRLACPRDHEIFGSYNNELHQTNRQDIEEIYDRSSASYFAENSTSFDDGDGTSDECIICG